jgi:hypothetical protein
MFMSTDTRSSSVPDQRPQFRNRYGLAVTAVPPRPALANLGWPHIHTMNRPLAIDAETNAPEWDGRRVRCSHFARFEFV